MDRESPAAGLGEAGSHLKFTPIPAGEFEPFNQNSPQDCSFGDDLFNFAHFSGDVRGSFDRKASNGIR
jgi:hypothetical protein